MFTQWKNNSTYHLSAHTVSRVSLVIILCIAGRSVFSLYQSSDIVDNRCLHCICYGMTKCNFSIGCETTDKKACGPYKISRMYWIEGGKLGSFSHIDEDNYVACSQDKTCAKNVIQEYNKLFYKDCNGNNIIDCVDFFRTHLAGPNLCKDTKMENTTEWVRFLECFLNTADSAEIALRSIRDLDKSGYIKPHIDSVRFCGDTIAGLCLLSTCVMRLVHEVDKKSWADILLKRRALYVMRGTARYKYTHEILSEENSKFRDDAVPRGRRISIMCRSEPSDTGKENTE